MRGNFLFILILVLSFGVLNISAQTPKPKTINGGVINGKALTLPKPEYPSAAQAVRASGAVNVQVTIDENGSVISASATSGHPLLRQAAEQAALQSTFKPTLLSGQPVKVTGVIIYNFVPSKIESSNEEKLMMMGLGAFLSISNIIPNDEWETPKKEDFVDTPQIAEELAPLTLITKETGKEKRGETIDKVIIALDNKLTGDDAWQFKFGKEFGALMLDLKMSGGTADHTIDETAVKMRLVRMKDLISSAPADFPQDILGKFKEIVTFADMPELSSDKNKARFAQLIVETLGKISPDLTQ